MAGVSLGGAKSKSRARPYCERAELSWGVRASSQSFSDVEQLLARHESEIMAGHDKDVKPEPEGQPFSSTTLPTDLLEAVEGAVMSCEDKNIVDVCCFHRARRVMFMADASRLGPLHRAEHPRRPVVDEE